MQDKLVQVQLLGKLYGEAAKQQSTKGTVVNYHCVQVVLGGIQAMPRGSYPVPIIMSALPSLLGWHLIHKLQVERD